MVALALDTTPTTGGAPERAWYLPPKGCGGYDYYTTLSATTTTSASSTIYYVSSNLDTTASSNFLGFDLKYFNTTGFQWVETRVGHDFAPCQVTPLGQRRRPACRVPQIQNHRGRLARNAQAHHGFDQPSPEEIRALQLLRKMVSEEVFRRYLKDGFVTVRGPSGYTYQIYRGEAANVRVYSPRMGQIAALCVHLKSAYKCPPTDSVVAKMLLAEMDEPGLWQRANVTLWGDDWRQKQQLRLQLVAQQFMKAA